MKKEDIFYFIFVLTILVIRLEVFLFPSNKIIVAGIRINHFWIGVILILFVLLLSKRYNGLRIAIFSIGLGLVADELIFMIFGNRTINDYWSIYSISGLIMTMIIVLVSRKKLVRKFAIDDSIL